MLLDQGSVQQIWQQMEWLPSREPRDPPAMLVSAVQGGWAAPPRHDPERAQEVWAAWMGSQSDHDGSQPDRDEPPPATEGPGGDETQAGEGDCPPLALPGTELDAREVWAGVLEVLRAQMTPEAFATWLEGSQVARVVGDEVVVQVSDEYAADWLRARWLVPIRRALSGIVGRGVPVRFEAEL